MWRFNYGSPDKLLKTLNTLDKTYRIRSLILDKPLKKAQSDQFNIGTQTIPRQHCGPALNRRPWSAKFKQFLEFIPFTLEEIACTHRGHIVASTRTIPT